MSIVIEQELTERTEQNYSPANFVFSVSSCLEFPFYILLILRILLSCQDLPQLIQLYQLNFSITLSII